MLILGLVALCAAGAAQAQFGAVPEPARVASPAASQAGDERAYRRDAARHVYASYPSRVHKGKLPPMLYAVMITDTEVDDSGRVLGVTVVRPPAAATEVTPWVVDLIRKASPFPAPSAIGMRAVYREVWLVDRSGRFQVDSLTEGQL
jgi:periplasmic protein TonB